MERALSFEDYTVAWISALPVELAAAKAMLDETHDSPPLPPSDCNAYTLGRLSGHNVAIACLPLGVYGANVATSVLIQMKSTFPWLQFCLLVGVAGAVPTNTDIRLGDVVVSKSVIQHDHGKMLHGGRFHRTGSLNNPPQSLLKAANQIESDYMMGKRDVQKNIVDFLEKNNEMKPQFSRPNDDWLFSATYIHQDNERDCSACDKSELVTRPPRATDEPCIHYGLVASGNQVIKDGQTRDRLYEELNVPCIEMEAAGLMNHHPCLVIRGICDYSDSHKQKRWQGYASLTAAAYAKLLLSRVPVASRQMKADLRIEHSPDEKACRRSLSIADPMGDMNRLKRNIGGPTPNTCEWIMSTPELKIWLGLQSGPSKPHPNILWLYGYPGVGKSTMAMAIIELLLSRSHFISEGHRLAYFFCSSDSANRQSATFILRSLLNQLVKKQGQKHGQLIRHVLPKFQERGEQFFESFDALWITLLEIACSNEDGIFYCIIDGLDECDIESQQTLLTQICKTFNSIAAKRLRIHFLITSQPYRGFQRFLYSFNSLNLSDRRESQDDLQIFIKEKVEELSRANNYTKKVEMTVLKALQENAQGTFLWVGIVCRELALVGSSQAVETLQKLPSDLNSLYDKLLTTALTANERYKETILKILGSVAISQRPLTLIELYTSCELYEDEDEEERLNFTREIIDTCRLISVRQDGTVSFLHNSVKDFLKDGEWIDLFKTHAALANRCISYILTNVGSRKPLQNGDLDNSWLQYAILYWPEHARLARSEFSILPANGSFFRLESDQRQEWLKAYTNQSMLFGISRQFSIFHIAAKWGLPALINFSRAEVSASSPRLPFQWIGKYSTTFSIIDEHVRSRYLFWRMRPLLNAKDENGRTPLHWAVVSRPGEDVDILLSNGADVNLQDNQSKSPLHVAAEVGNPKLVQHLLRRHADPNQRSHIGDSPLHLAIRPEKMRPRQGETWAELYAVETLADYIDDFESEEASEIFREIEDSRRCTVDMLLRSNAVDVNIANNHGDYPIHVIEFYKRHAFAILTSLLDSGADSSKLNGEKKTCLHLASEAGNLDAVRILVKNGCDITLLDASGLSPIHYAVHNNRVEIVQLMFKSSPNAKFYPCWQDDHRGRNLLHYYAESLICSIDMLNLLLDNEFDINSLDVEGNSVLSIYLSSFRLRVRVDIFQSIVKGMSDKNNTQWMSWLDKKKRNLAHMLMRQWDEDNVAILNDLLKAGVDKNAKDTDGRGIVHHGAIHGSFNKVLVRYLGEEGILQLHERDRKGKTSLEYAEEEANRERHIDLWLGHRWKESFHNLKYAGQDQVG
ncbi:hypothetical protein BGW36DRAFT_328708 [Talaromyces proteolyticus]|uniref:Uncharacterized protein n=1 Tax=Talaromyces proteolyticus TaxID=1131652 RepID=A0AAD4KFJ5_9EURO|nr:uncharacterized protein BGW36DRAFT_328708 [Talaromyces proteolyticus]KAH8690777.1 hypothetical protein BGW36DRAFT_328708 [Talaromyces proteolyticus]